MPVVFPSGRAIEFTNPDPSRSSVTATIGVVFVAREEGVLIHEISDGAVEVAGTRTEIAGPWTFICTAIQWCRPGRPGCLP